MVNQEFPFLLPEPREAPPLFLALASWLSSFSKISLCSANQHLAKYEYDQSDRYIKDLVHTKPAHSQSSRLRLKG